MQRSQHYLAVAGRSRIIDATLSSLQKFIWTDYHVERHRYSAGLLHILPDLWHLVVRGQARLNRSFSQSLSITLYPAKWKMAGLQSTTTKSQTVDLEAKHRKSIETAIRETCDLWNWFLQAINVRTNHIHTVVSASHKKPEHVLGAFKANATRQLREDHLWSNPFSPWADKGSKRRLWNEQSVARAIDYVLNGQGDDLPDFDD